MSENKQYKDYYTVKQFDKTFDPIIEDDLYHFETKDEMLEYIKENNISYGEELYRYVWTMVDGDSDKIILINGFHVVNRLGYVLCRKPWGFDNNTEFNKNMYIESKY